MKIFTAEELSAYLARQFEGDTPGTVNQVNAWLARGDGIAVYENCDLGARDLGAVKLVSYGSSSAMLETGEPPANMPDTPGQVNWRYQLHGTYRGAQLAMPAMEGQAGEAHAHAAYLNSHGYTATVWRYETALDNYGPADRRTRYVSGYAVKYDGQLIRDDGSRAEYPSKGLTVFCEDSELPLAQLVKYGRALVAYGNGYVPMYVASYNPRESDRQRDQSVNPGIFQTVNLHELTRFDVAPDGPRRYFDLHLTEVTVS